MAHDLTVIVDEEVLSLGFFSPTGAGEENDGANVGAGARVYRDKVGSVLNLRTVTGVGDVSVAENGDEIEISQPAFSAHAADSSIHFTQGRVVDSGYAEATAQSTTSATFEDVVGAALSLTVPVGQSARIFAALSLQTSTTGGAPSTGAWAISINNVDQTEVKRYLSGSNDTGLGGVNSSAVLGAGTYVIKVRHRRVSGGSTINTDVAQLIAFAVAE